jgi:exodeoxyribonuclease-3
MKIATWNVNGIRAREAQFVEWVERDRPDVVCLQEIKATAAQLSETLTALPGYWSYWHGGPKGYSGVSLHVRKDRFPSQPEFRHPAFDIENRVVEAALDSGLVVASVYVPNGGKDFAAKIVFLEKLAEHARTLRAQGRRLVVAGDLNIARTEKDVTLKQRDPRVIGQRPEERELLERLVGAGLVDIARTLEPDSETLFTWWPPWRGMREKNRGWRIDYILASDALTATHCEVLATVGTSDHAPVVAMFA